MNFTNARNPEYNEDGTITLEVQFEEFGDEWLPFTATPYDVEAHGVEIFNKAKNGDFGKVVEFVLTIDMVRERKMAELQAWITAYQGKPYVDSSVGFRIDANETANTNITGLIEAIEAGMLTEPQMFRDYNNEFHSVTLENLKTMQLEVIANGQQFYQTKWNLEQQIQSAETIEEIQAVEIPVIDAGNEEESE